MLSTNIVNNQPKMSVPTSAGGAPETAQFDFMNYLLGLRSSPSGELAGGTKADAKALTALLEAPSPDSGAEGVTPQKKENSPWNLIFPGMTAPGPMPNLPLATANGVAPAGKGAEVPGAVDPAGLVPVLAGKNVSPVEAQLLTRIGLQAASKPEATATPAVAVDVPGAPQSLSHQAIVLGAEILVDRGAKGEEPFRGSLAELKQHGLANPPSNPLAVCAPVAMNRYAQVHSRYAIAQATDQNSVATAMSHPGVELATAPADRISSDRKQLLPNSGVAANAHVGGSILTAGASAHVATSVANGPEPHQASAAVPHLFARVENLANQGGGKMTVSLTPPELGKVEVEVITRGKRVEIKMTSQNDAAKSVLESGLADLRRSLEGQNLQLTQANVRVGSDSVSAGQGQTAQHFSQPGGGFHSQSEGRSFSSWNDGPIARASEPVVRRLESEVVRPRAVAPGRVDVRI